MSLDHRWEHVLNDLRRSGRYRELAAASGVDFSSNDFLGYANAGAFGLPLNRDLGLSATASRLLRGHHPIWDEVETKLAAWHGAESALMMTSGYAANEGLLSTVIEPGDWVASDERNHASIIDGLRLTKAEKFIFRHLDLNHLESGLRNAASSGRESFVVTESLFSMDGDCAPLAAMAELCERHGAHLIVDEAHSTGCFGPSGSGCVSGSVLHSRILATVHTGGKAMGVFGAYICGSRRLREILINRCRHLIFSTALPPIAGAWWLAALERIRHDDAGRNRLHGNAVFFRGELERQKVTPRGTEYIIPIIIGEDDRAVRISHKLRGCGWDIRAIRPPSVPNGQAMLRISIHANHDRETLAQLATAVAERIST